MAVLKLSGIGGAWEHVVQDFDSTKSNFGVVADSPQRIDVNFGSGNASSSDWLHMNSIDYYGYYDFGRSHLAECSDV